MTRKRWRILIAGFGLLLIVALAFILSEPAEPKFKDRRLSEWVADITPTVITRTPPTPVRGPRGATPIAAQRAASIPRQMQMQLLGSTNRTIVKTTFGGPVPTWVIFAVDPKHSAAAEAIREIGTNAIPHLLREIYSRDSKLKTTLVTWSRKQKALALPFKTALEKQQRALPALWELDDRALWNWVEIVTNNAASRECQLYAAERLAELRYRATPALSALMFMDNHPDAEVRRSIGYAIQNCDREGFVAALWNLRHSSNANCRASGAWSLGFRCKNPDMSIPALVAAMRDSSRLVRENAVQSLGKFGEEALSVTNTICRAMEDPDRRVRVAATNALNQVLGIEVTSE